LNHTWLSGTSSKLPVKKQQQQQQKKKTKQQKNPHFFSDGAEK